MRVQQERSGSLFSCIPIGERIPASHPLWRIRKQAEQAIDRLNPTGEESQRPGDKSPAGVASSFRGSSDHPIRAGAVQNLKQLLKKSLHLRALLRVVDGAEGASSHAAIDLLEGVGRVHQEMDGDVSGGEGHYRQSSRARSWHDRVAAG